jgi:hypothetical protein
MLQSSGGGRSLRLVCCQAVTIRRSRITSVTAGVANAGVSSRSPGLNNAHAHLYVG